MSAWLGRCHCGAVGFEYRTSMPPAEWSVRACQCSFCQKHGAAYTSDAAGSVRFMHEDAAALSRYRFGHKTADFVFCGRCGGYLGAVTEEEGQSLMVHQPARARSAAGRIAGGATDVLRRGDDRGPELAPVGAVDARSGLMP